MMNQSRFIRIAAGGVLRREKRAFSRLFGGELKGSEKLLALLTEGGGK